LASAIIVAMAPVRVFISYSHDSEAHKAWVLKLASDLRAGSVDASLDRWDLAFGQDTSAFMQRGITESDRVVLVCTEKYVNKAEAGSGGVGYERLIVTAELVQNIDTKKFIPLIRDNGPKKTPTFLGPRLHVDFSDDAQYQAKLEELLREILGEPSAVKPPLGPNPFSGSAPATGTGRTAGPTGVTPSGQLLLDDGWFAKGASTATAGIAKLKLSGHMELRFSLHAEINKSQLELLNAVKASEIRTFGWPIGVVLNRDEFRPLPYEDGIRAEISIAQSTMSGRPSYDFWALRNNGDFYLLQSLFEDDRSEKKIYFNTRIVRVTEALMFASNLYKNLGVAPETHLSVRVTHRGLADRELTSAGINRVVLPSAPAQANESKSEIVVSVGSVLDTIVEEVRRLLAPMFMLFDFREFNESVYRDIVTRFVKGQST
jgi:TIR domain-containing protein